MPKFYVQCGPIHVVLLAESVENAAMAGLDRSLQNHLWIYDDPRLSEQDCQDHLMIEALLHLEPTVRVSEIGFDRKDASQVNVPELIVRWHEMMVGMNQLFALAGLGPRSMQSLEEEREPMPQPRQPR